MLLFVVGPDGASSLPTTPLSDLSNITLHPDMKPSFGQHMTVTMATTVPTCSTTGGVIPSVVNSRNDVTVEVIPGVYVCGKYCMCICCICDRLYLHIPQIPFYCFTVIYSTDSQTFSFLW